MYPVPPEQWKGFCAERSAALQGRAARFEVLDQAGAAELIADTLFDGLRLEGADAAPRLLAWAGGRELYAASSLTSISHGADDALLIEAEGRPSLRITFAPAGRAAPVRLRRGRTLHERAVG